MQANRFCKWKCLCKIFKHNFEPDHSIKFPSFCNYLRNPKLDPALLCKLFHMTEWEFQFSTGLAVLCSLWSITDQIIYGWSFARHFLGSISHFKIVDFIRISKWGNYHFSELNLARNSPQYFISRVEMFPMLKLYWRNSKNKLEPLGPENGFYPPSPQSILC